MPTGDSGNPLPPPPPPPPPIVAASEDPNTPAITGESLTQVFDHGIYRYLAGSGVGVLGSSGTGNGVSGTSLSGIGVSGTTAGNTPGVAGYNNAPAAPTGGQPSQASGVWGQSQNADGVVGVSHGVGYAGVSGVGHGCLGGRFTSGTSAIPWEDSGLGDAVAGNSQNGCGGWFSAAGAGQGVYAKSVSGHGVVGESQTSDGGTFTSGGVGNGVWGQSGDPGRSGVAGNNLGNGNGVWGNSIGGYGVFGISQTGVGSSGITSGFAAGVSGINNAPPAGPDGPYGILAVGLRGESQNSHGIYGISHSGGSSAGIYGDNDKGGLAGYFNGDVWVTGDVVFSNATGADIAEDFDLEGNLEIAEPGTVLVINSSGRLSVCLAPYDTRVAGVVSGAGAYKPAVVLQRRPISSDRRTTIALVGKTYCKVDATKGSIIAGDLLTTSATPGHAMKVADRSQALGAILGKALKPLSHGIALIPILVSLR